jgi:hypothetical protein
LPFQYPKAAVLFPSCNKLFYPEKTSLANMNNAQRQQLQQQQQQQQQQQFKLRNPTQYHLQMQQARSSQQGSKPDYYNVDSQLWSSDFFNSLQQHQSNESPKLEDMDFGDTVNTSMVSPHSTSSPLHEFEDMNDFTVTGPSTNPSSFGTHGMKSPLRKTHLSGAELFGESPANSVHSYGLGEGQQDMHYQEPGFPTSGSPQVSVPIDMRKVSGNFANTMGNQYPMYIPGSFEKQPHVAMSAPANIGFAGQAFGSSYPNNTAFGSHMPSSSLRMQADDAADLAGSMDDEYGVQLK